jgi:hypothetical protein
MALILKGFFDHSGRADGLQGAQKIAPRSSSRCRLVVVFFFSSKGKSSWKCHHWFRSAVAGWTIVPAGGIPVTIT